ncbi:cytochrome c-type biogenesis protein [Gemmobacter denitrificans]|uniref:Cytochrome c-type biogenesis protein n=1 Tax=Gemmobacter denitrificans TaxID=3123040 RepID=A0ABU8BPE3_9RHOB
MRHAFALTLCLALLAAPAWAVKPDEILADPALEARARDLSRVLRCPVCQSENIDDSNADLARDLRLLVRERLVAGDSDDEVIAFVVARYGEYVLFDPPASGSTLLLWLAGPAMLLGGGAMALLWLRKRAQIQPAALSAEEEARLQEILRK